MEICKQDCKSCKYDKVHLCIQCRVCERRNKLKKDKCLVFLSKPKKCWAFTTDVDEYREGGEK